MLTKIKSIVSNVWADLVDTYKRLKILLIAIAGILLALEWAKIKQALLVYSAKKEIQNTDNKDKTLSTEEQKDSQQADALIEESKKLSTEQQPVGEDWYLKK